MRIALVLHDNFSSAAAGAILDIFRVAEAVRARIDPSIRPFRVLIAGTRKRVTSAVGMKLDVALSVGDLSGRDVDVLLLSALGSVTEDQTEQMLASRSVRTTVRALERTDLNTARIAAACTGVFSLAETGMLEGRTVTTTWYQAPLFRRRYPGVDLSLETMVVVDGNLITAGAAFAHIDLALALLRHESALIADEVTRMLLVDERHSQSTYVAYDHFQHQNDTVRSFERYVRENLSEPLSVESVCRTIGVGRRKLERATKEAVAMSPLEIVRRLRVERARHLKRTTELSMDQISEAVGYQSTDSLRALLRSTKSVR